ncbi:hypothetical protein KC19_10G088800 [Ceratodon purpureus]|uniref:LysM domain-containing protein n=1 Tax=Ceratodon purpureus TaxID=3225 RepID=A0A8T0GNA3_CERPU|nr:hypothetical protein KC19_10G088800 [Ceratodon purpureus]
MADRAASSSDASTSGSGVWIEHTVSKLDTLAGVAIKYGVEVADIKRFNGLTTDLQMFALKTLRIPPARHPHSTDTTNFGRFRHETSATRSGLHRVRSQDSNLNHKGPERTQRSSAMELLRGYYGLPSSRTEEGTELATFSTETEITEDEPYSPMFRASDTAESRRFSTRDFRTSRFDQTRETKSSLSDSGWLINSPEPPIAASGLLMKSSRDPLGVDDRFGEIKVVTEADLLTKERPIRRRPRGDFGSDEMIDVSERVNLPEKSPALRAKDSNSSLPYNRQVNSVTTNSWHNAGDGPLASGSVKTIGAAIFGGKGAVEGLISKVLQSSNPATVQEVGKSSTGAALGTPSVIEGITQAYRRAKAALD